MKQYEVTGMSCAACSARVEKAVSKVPGVTSCSVSLLTNSMGVEGTATDQEIVNAVFVGALHFFFRHVGSAGDSFVEIVPKAQKKNRPQQKRKKH